MIPNIAKIIHVDPALPELLRLQIFIVLYVRARTLRYQGMIKYNIDNELYHKDYVVNYTNASFIIRDDFDFQDGLFSGYDPAKGAYDTTTWDYKYDENGNIMQDPTLQDPRCVFQLLKKHYSRYDIDTVCSITGSPKKKYEEVLKLYCSTGAPDKPAVSTMPWVSPSIPWAARMLSLCDSTAAAGQCRPGRWRYKRSAR